MKKILTLILFIVILSGCSYSLIPKANNSINDSELDLAMAKFSLNNFLSLLNLMQYQQAVAYYGGDYAVLETLNPDIEPKQKDILLKSYCQNNQGACLAFKLIKQEVSSDNTFIFTAQFYNPDNTVFATAGCPCKGGGKKEFELKVKKVNNSQYLIMDLPPLLEAN